VQATLQPTMTLPVAAKLLNKTAKPKAAAFKGQLLL
jgi:hypothetical protein